MPSNLTQAEIAVARAWLLRHSHETHVRHVLERGLEYAEAVVGAGLSMELTDGDDLYRFLSDPRVDTARSDAFVQPTL